LQSKLHVHCCTVYNIHVVANSTGQATNPCGPIIVANYLMHVMEKLISLLCGLFCTCGMQKLGEQ